MNPRLLELYNQELHHVRESAADGLRRPLRRTLA